MKNVTALLMIALGIFVNAQFNNSEFIKWGVTANFHKGSIVNVHDVSKGRFGGGGGVFADYALVENDVFDSAWMYLEPQLEFSMQGELAHPEENESDIQKYSHNYVAGMLYLKYFFHKGNMKRDLFVFAGPRFEYLISNKKETSAFYETNYGKYNLDDHIEKFGYGVSFGTGLTINRQLEAFIRYDRGFSKVYTDNPANTYNRLLAVGINYFLNRNW